MQSELYRLGARSMWRSGMRMQHIRWVHAQQGFGFSNRASDAPASRDPRKNVPFNFGFVIVPQQSNFIVERFGRFHRLLQPGLQIIIPVVDHIAYAHSLKEEAINIPNQTAITRDNVTINIDGVLYMKVEDAVAASYGVEDPYRAVSLLAQTTMRSELGKLTLDKTFEEREALNALIVAGINEAAAPWGIRCLRYEIRDINPPENVRRAMELQAEAERRKRAQILDSEAEKQSDINVAEGHKRSVILASEADQVNKVNAALGEANEIIARSKAIGEGLQSISKSIRENRRGIDAVSLRVAEQYIEAFRNLAERSDSIIIPESGASGGNLSSLIAQAVTIASKLSETAKVETKPVKKNTSNADVDY